MYWSRARGKSGSSGTSGSAGFQDADHTDHHVGGSIRTEADTIAHANASCNQSIGKPVCALVQLGIRQSVPVRDDRNRITVIEHRFGECSLNRDGIILYRSLIPLFDNSTIFVAVEKADVAEQV